MPNLKISLYNEIIESVQDRVTVMQCNKPTLVSISHAIEDIILKNRLPALMFTGFQESSYWAKETKRYRELVEVAKQVCIFAGKPLPEDSALGAMQVELAPDDPLRQEWFVLILSQEFAALLCGKDQELFPYAEDLRLFDTILSFDISVIRLTVERLKQVLQNYRPELLGQLESAEQGFLTNYTPNPLYFTMVINEMVSFQSKLNQRLQVMQEEQREATAELDYQRNFNDMLVELSSSFMVITDVEGNIVTMNPAIQDLLGLSLSDALTTRVVENFVDKDDYARLVKEIEVALRNHTSWHGQVTILDIHGNEHFTEWNVRIADSVLANEKWLLCIGYDISELERARHLQQQQALLEIELQKEREMAEFRTNFMGAVSHEFRTPLAIIFTSTQLIRRYFDKLSRPNIEKRLMRIQQQADVLAEMVDEITKVIEMELGMLTLQLEPLQIAEFCEEIIQSTLMLNENNTYIKFNSNIPKEQIINVDRTLLRRILGNLLSNAMKYSPPNSEVIFDLNLVTDHLEIRIVDRGIGIPQEEQEKIFMPFFRAKNARNIRGTGLGLRVVADSVAVYEGKISFKSSGRGTVFNITLPVSL
jgi:PAS domain S-box-containing protein